MMIKLTIFLAFLSFAVIALQSYFVMFKNSNLIAKVVFCDVGQGDATLVLIGNWQALIDLGPAQGNVVACLRHNIGWFDRTIELVIITHPDSDHVAGFDSLSRQYQVKNVIFWAGNFEQTTLDRQAEVISSLLKGRGFAENLATTKEILIDDKNKITVLSPEIWLGESVKAETVLWDKKLLKITKSAAQEIDTNDGSIVIILNLNHTRIAIMGDAPISSETAIIQRRLITDIDVLKVAHHGSKTSTSLEWLKETSPEHAVISAGFKNPFGHPHKTVLDLLIESGVHVWRTDEDGEVRLEIKSDGRKFYTTTGVIRQ